MMWQCNGVTYHGTLEGRGEETILFLHGFTGSYRTWQPFFPILNKHYQLLSIDVIGHGQTEAPKDYHRYAIDQVVNDLVSILDQLNITKSHVVGYSMGGRVAITLASLYPDRVASLLLESTTPGLNSEQERLERLSSDNHLATMIEREGLLAFIDYWEQLPLFASQANLENSWKEAVRQERLSHKAIGLANSLRGMGTGAMPSWWEHLTLFHFPVHIVTGELDHKFTHIAQQMVERNTSFQHTVVKGAGHCVHLDNPQVFTALLKQIY